MRRWALTIGCALLGGCATVMSSVTADLADSLSESILNSRDIQVVRDGAPAYLLLLDGLIAKSPNNPSLLRAGASLNSAYATAFVDDPERVRYFAGRALEFAERAACEVDADACSVRDMPFEAYRAWVAGLEEDDVPVMYDLATAWAGWIRANRGDWSAIAELQRVKTLMARIAELDPTYRHGGPELYLGVFETLFPPAMGGRPEVGRAHFERAVAIGGDEYLMTKVLYAREYARLVFDRELHDALLESVLAADPVVEGVTLINLVAQQQARELLASADEYF